MASDSSNSISVSPCSPPPARGNAGDHPVADRARHGRASGASFSAASLMAVPSGASTAISTQNDVKRTIGGAGRAALRRTRVAGGTKFRDGLPPPEFVRDQAFAVARRQRLGNSGGFQTRLRHAQRGAIDLRARIGTHRNHNAGRYRAKAQRQDDEGHEDFDAAQSRARRRRLSKTVRVCDRRRALHRLNRGSPVSQFTAMRADRPSSVSAISPPDDWPSG